MGILIGAYGPRLHMVAYTTQSANLMMRSLGLSMYLACLGLDAGSDFLDTVVQPAALRWIAFSALLTALPMAVMAVVAVVWRRSRLPPQRACFAEPWPTQSRWAT